MNGTRKATAGAAIMVSAALAVVVCTAYLIGAPQSSGSTPVAVQRSESKGVAGLAAKPCSGDAVLAALARLKSGTSVVSVQQAGYVALPLIRHLPNAASTLNGAKDMIAVLPGTSSAAGIVEGLKGLPVVATAGVLLAQSSNPTLRSCAYDVSDKPAAVALVQPAEAVARAQGYLTSPVLVALVSDDPTASGDMTITLDVDGGVIGSQPGALGGQLHSMKSILALVTSQGTVLDVGYGPW